MAFELGTPFLTALNRNLLDSTALASGMPANLRSAADVYSTAQITAYLADKANTNDVDAALLLKAPIASPTFTGTVSGITKAMVGLGNADNTSDASKPISTATQTALDLKAASTVTYPATGAQIRLTVNKLIDSCSINDFFPNGALPANATTGVQAALNACVLDNILVRLPPGTYNVDNLTYPHNTDYDSNPPFWNTTPKFLGEPGVVIKKRNSADNSYLFAGSRWATNLAFGMGPVWMEDIVFDGAGIAQDVFIHISYASILRRLVIKGGTRHGLVEPQTTKNGTQIAGSRSVNRYENLQIYENIGTGFLVKDGSSFITDAWMTDCIIYNNGINVDLEQCVGWKIRDPHYYNTTAPDAAATYSARYCKPSKGSIVGGVYEGYPGQTYGLELQSDGSGVVASDIAFLLGKGINVTFANGGVGHVMVKGCKFNGAESRIRHAYSGTSAELRSEGNTFEATDPYQFSSGGAHAGILNAHDDRIVGDMTVYEGRQYHNSYSAQSRKGLDYATVDSSLTSISARFQRVDAVLTADRYVRLPASPKRGQEYYVTRSANSTGAFNLKVQTSAGVDIVFLLTSKYAHVVYDGSAWTVVGYGDAQ